MRCAWKRILLVPMAALWLSRPAGAAEPTQVVPEQTPRVPDTPADRFGVMDGAQLQVSTGTDDDNVTFSIALPTGPSQANRFSLVASAPIHGGDDAMPASLDALVNGTRVTLRWGHFGFVRGGPDDRARAIMREQQDLCAARLPDPQNPAHRRIGGACADTNQLVHDLALPRYREYLSHMIHGAVDYGIDATAGINDFEWLEPVTFIPQKARHTDWSVAGHFSYYEPGLALTGSASYQRAYEAAEKQLLCPPNTTSPATQCRTDRGVGPTRNEHFLLSASLRYRFAGSDGRLLPLAVAPLGTYDVTDDVWGVDVPVYFIPGAGSGLTGGVRFGYRSDRDDHFSIGVFVGAAFNILN